MRTFLALLLLFGLLPAPVPSHAGPFVDAAGRRVDLPDRVSRIYASGPPASIYLYVLKPQALLGWPRALHAEERPYIAPAYRDLPATGRLTGRGNEGNLERMLALKPDLIVDVGSVTPTYVDLANRVQKQTGIPYILIDGRFDNSAGAIRQLGKAIGVTERAETLARDIERNLARAELLVAGIAPDKRPRVYLARTADGLETGLQGSINSELIERAGGVNVMTAADGRRGLVRVSMENLYLANPDTIVTWDADFHASVWTNSLWQGIDAVAKKRVYLSPVLPFGWIDRPPSLNRLVGLNWLLHLLHPDRIQGDLRSEVRDFYRLYYHVDLDERALSQLMDSAPR